MARLPIMVQLKNRRVIVVGGGSAARRKVSTLCKAKARVIVVAPDVVKEIAQLAQGGELRWWPRAFKANDCRCASLVVAATDNRKTNSEVLRSARRHGALAIACDGRRRSSSFCATFPRGRLTFAVHSGGLAPALSVHLKERMARQFGPEWERVGAIFGSLRKQIKALSLSEKKELALWKSILQGRAMEAILVGDEKSYREEVEQCISSL